MVLSFHTCNLQNIKDNMRDSINEEEVACQRAQENLGFIGVSSLSDKKNYQQTTKKATTALH